MSTRHLVDPELLDLVDAVPAAPLTIESLPLLRAGGREQLASQPQPLVSPVERIAPALDAGPPVVILHYRPPDQAPRSAAVLHIHGGGMISGQARLTTLGSAAQALAAGLPVFSVDYRLAPEHPFPSAPEDCYAALAWLFAEADSLGIDPARIIVSGDSAGGGLAAGLAHMVRDRGELSLAGQVLTYPMLDYRTALAEFPGPPLDTGEFCWTRQENGFAWAAYRGDYGLSDHMLGWFSPAMAGNFAGLAPTWIGVGALDLFRNECIGYAEALGRNGVAVDLKLYSGAPHAFNAHPDARVAQAYRADVEKAFETFAQSSAGRG